MCWQKCEGCAPFFSFDKEHLTIPESDGYATQVGIYIIGVYLFKTSLYFNNTVAWCGTYLYAIYFSHLIVTI